MAKYEYMIIEEYKEEIPGDWINKRGSEGWELVSIIDYLNSEGTELLRYHFKRVSE